MQFITVNHVCPDLIPDRELTVTQLVLDDGVQIHYTITPALPTDPGLQPYIHWDYEVTDDHQTEYTDCGGSYAPAGEATNGMLCLTPVPPSANQQLTIRLRPWREAEGDLGHCTITVMVPIEEEKASTDS